MKPTEQNVGVTAPSQYPYMTVYQPTQYHHFPYPYSSYYPLLNLFHPITNGYVLQPVSQDTSNPLISAVNPQCSCDNNANTEQRNRVSTTDKTVRSNEIEKFDAASRNNIFKEEKKNEKNGIMNKIQT